MTNDDKIDILYFYCCKDMGVVSARKNTDCIANHVDCTSHNIYDFLKSMGINKEHKNNSAYGKGKDCGIFSRGKYTGLVDRDVIRDFVESGDNNIIDFVNDYIDENSSTVIKNNRTNEINRDKKGNENKDKKFNSFGEAIKDPAWLFSSITQIGGLILCIVLVICVANNGLGSLTAITTDMNFVKIISFIFVCMVTKPILKAKSTGFNIGGKLIILFALWGGTLYYIGNY